jgi:hypothetical protein
MQGLDVIRPYVDKHYGILVMSEEPAVKGFNWGEVEMTGMHAWGSKFAGCVINRFRRLLLRGEVPNGSLIVKAVRTSMDAMFASCVGLVATTKVAAAVRVSPSSIPALLLHAPDGLWMHS